MNKPEPKKEEHQVFKFEYVPDGFCYIPDVSIQVDAAILPSNLPFTSMALPPDSTC